MISQSFKTTRQDSWPLGLGIGVSLLAVGAASFGIGGQNIVSLLLMAFGLGWGLSWCFNWLWLRQNIARPLEQLNTVAEMLATKDSIALAGALDALGRGELTVQVTLQAQTLPLPAFPPLSRLTYTINQLITSLQDCAQEFNLMTSMPSQRVCFVGPDDYLMGRACGKAMGQAMGGQGQVAILVGFHSPPNIGRRRGFESMLREQYPGIEVVGVEETHISTQVTYELTQDFLQRYSHLGGIYITEGATPSGIGRALVEASLAGQVKVVAHDLVDETMAYVAKGVITATVGQSPYTQGHDAVIHLFNHLVTGWQPETPRLVVEPEVVTPDNYREYWQPGSEVIVAEKTAARLAKPMQPSPRPLRIVVMGSSDAFWRTVWAGVEAAAQELGAYNATVEKFVDVHPLSSSWLTNKENLVERALGGEYDGVVTPLGPPEFYPIFNRLSVAGIPVVVVNVEQPTSFRGLIAMLGEQTQRLVEVSHELRTPLSLLVGLSEMMLTMPQPDAPPLPEIYRRDLERIRASAQQLKWLIGDVLDLASSQAGQLRLAKARLPLREVVQAAAAIGAEMVHAKGLQWRTEIPDELPVVWGDRARLQQVIVNLLANACKFTKVGEVCLAVRVAEAGVYIAVSDTGVGVPAGEQAAIFDEFSKSTRTAGQGYGGLGLGLTITRRLVNMHGGHIWVESSGKPGQGSTFTFTLPVLTAALEPAEVGVEGARHRQMVLLVTGRQDTDGEVWQRLRQTGWEVKSMPIPETGGPGQMEAWVAQALTPPPGAVVLDLVPDSERSSALMHALTMHPASRDIPVVFYAHLPGQGEGAVMELDYLTKPVGHEVLGEMLARHGVAEGAGSKIILVVDDEPELLDLHRRMVEQQAPGCRVLLAQNGQQALAAMGQERPDLVLLDLIMPEMDGFGVLEAMQADDHMRGIPVIVLTAQVLTEKDMARLIRGVAAVLSKGVFSVPEVSAQIALVLERNKRAGSETQRVVRQAMAYVHEHYAESISREDVAHHVGIHENYLSRCFHQEMGITPVVYLNRYRIKQAKALLEANRPVTEVALAVGFSSSEYFSRVFSAEVGVSPSAYRRGDRPHDSPSARGGPG
jgi:signal transduction histidine kinase/AraC-like DNA-binding protein